MNDIEQLTHQTRTLPGGGMVLVLNTGAAIDAEAEAMLQALHSRSVGGVHEHLTKLAEKGAHNFMSRFYVGYGHKSIGDCGSCTIFIEGVSMLAAKAIQDWPLYSGQESSTRYIDFANQAFRDPVETDTSHALLERWRSFYLKGVADLVPALSGRYPKKEDEDERTYEKAIQARAFDIMRGFLPAGASTNLAWHSNLRQVADKLGSLRHHPLAEVREIADAIEQAVAEAYPGSFDPQKRYEDTEAYTKQWMQNAYLFESGEAYPAFAVSRDTIDRSSLAEYRALLQTRPEKTELPRLLAECGDMQFQFLLDFGSFRDLQRQRAVTQRMPLVTTRHGFEPWYLDELTPELRAEANELLSEQERTITGLDTEPAIAQYYIAMGYRLPMQLTGTLPALTYLVELRAAQAVHATLRQRALQIADELEERFGDSGLTLHVDRSESRFDVRRGAHDIVEKE